MNEFQAAGKEASSEKRESTREASGASSVRHNQDDSRTSNHADRGEMSSAGRYNLNGRIVFSTR